MVLFVKFNYKATIYISINDIPDQPVNKKIIKFSSLNFQCTLIKNCEFLKVFIYKFNFLKIPVEQFGNGSRYDSSFGNLFGI